MSSVNPEQYPVQLADLRPEEPFGVDDFFEMSLDNVCAAGLDGYFKRLSPSWTRTLGWSIEELMARPSVEFVHPEDREMTLAGRERLRSGTTVGPLTNRYLCKDGSFRWFEWRSVADNARGPVYAVARDVTEQKRDEQRLAEAKELQGNLQRQLIFADRMASVGTLAAGVAHEINNPLAKDDALACVPTSAKLPAILVNEITGGYRSVQWNLDFLTRVDLVRIRDQLLICLVNAGVQGGIAIVALGDSALRRLRGQPGAKLMTGIRLGIAARDAILRRCRPAARPRREISLWERVSDANNDPVDG